MSRATFGPKNDPTTELWTRRVRIKINDGSVEPRPGSDRSVQLLAHFGAVPCRIVPTRYVSGGTLYLYCTVIVQEVRLNLFTGRIASFLRIRRSGRSLSYTVEAPGSKPDRSYSDMLFMFLVKRVGTVGIATRYELQGPRFASRWRRDFLYQSRHTLGPTQSPLQWVPSLFMRVEQPAVWRQPSTPPPSTDVK